MDICQPPDDCYYRTYTFPSFMHQPRFDFDHVGYPALLYNEDGIDRLATWTGSEWRIETVGFAPGDLAFDPATGDATIASYVPSAPGQKAGLVFYRRTGVTSDPWPAESVVRGTARRRSCVSTPWVSSRRSSTGRRAVGSKRDRCGWPSDKTGSGRFRT